MRLSCAREDEYKTLETSDASTLPSTSTTRARTGRRTTQQRPSASARAPSGACCHTHAAAAIASSSPSPSPSSSSATSVTCLSVEAEASGADARTRPMRQHRHQSHPRKHRRPSCLPPPISREAPRTDGSRLAGRILWRHRRYLKQRRRYLRDARWPSAQTAARVAPAGSPCPRPHHLRHFHRRSMRPRPWRGHWRCALRALRSSR